MLSRKSTSLLIVLVLVPICGWLCLAFTAAKGDEKPKAEPSKPEPVFRGRFPAAEGNDDSKKETATTVYSVGKMSPETVLQVLVSVVPEAVLTTESEEKRLIAVATPADHAKIVASLKSLEKVVDVAQIPFAESVPHSKDELRTTVYAIGEMTARSVVPVMSETAPGAIFSVGEDDKTLIVVGKPADHEKVCETLRSLAKPPMDVTTMSFTRGPLAEDEPRIVVYAVEEKTVETLLPMLQTTVPEMQASVGEDNRTLIVYGKQADQEEVCDTIRSLGQKPVDLTRGPPTAGVLFSGSDKRQTIKYVIGNRDAESLIRDLSTAVPDAQFAIVDGMLTVHAAPDDQEKTIACLRSLGQPLSVYAIRADAIFGPSPGSGDAKENLQTIEYTTGDTSIQTLIRVMMATPSEVEFVIREDDKSLVVVADSAEHERICSVVPSLRKKTFPVRTPYYSGYLGGPQYARTSGYAPKQAPADAEMAKLEQADANQGKMVAKIVEQYKAAVGKEQQDEVRLELETAVNEHFSVRQQRRELEVAHLEARLKEIRQSIANRYEMGEEIVARQIAKLLGETDELEF